MSLNGSQMNYLQRKVSNYLGYFAIAVSVTGLGAIAAVPASASESASLCPLSDRRYRDANGQGFELVFSKPDPVEHPVSPVAAAIRWRDEELYSTGITVSNGYGSYYWLTEHDALRMDFFNADLTAAGLDTEEPAQAIVFISGLGSYDYYTRRDQITETGAPLILDTLWVFDRCQA